jgi:hypothetical protein
MGNCTHPGDVLSQSVVDYAEQHYADYFEAPQTMEGRGPTDLQLYAMEQAPAPAN